MNIHELEILNKLTYDDASKDIISYLEDHGNEITEESKKAITIKVKFWIAAFLSYYAWVHFTSRWDDLFIQPMTDFFTLFFG